ncbi:S8 family serine peptidase [Jannaschia seohaensis]|uniref:Hemolysin type calcium-binding protein n=1 Tax=Jannaschia seohaensis TaxID=475081 RepID=A0A2Y9BZD9_9RHOB|nr:S8 family serine peptidase [Jannaschia seohaensis]PWJ20196.1 hemolysin type calcium-binding protein [Jannaschia seohaensis]SSA44182.1 Hemolysin-type calcium-binding repeat-containing protein [Jannaschia seohaensis]
MSEVDPSADLVAPGENSSVLASREIRLQDLSRAEKAAYRGFAEAVAEAGGFELSRSLIGKLVDGEVGKKLLPIGQKLLPLWSGESSATYDPADTGMVSVSLIGERGQMQAMRKALSDLGIAETGSVNNAVDVLVAIEDLPKLLTVPGLRDATPNLSMTNAGAVLSQGAESMGTDDFNAKYRVDGSGVKIGVLSDSFDTARDNTANPPLTTYADDIATGDLPAGVTILQDFPFGSDEGRAMAQLIYDVAPGVTFSYHTAFGGEATFAGGIDALVADGADIIVDDVFYAIDPVYLDGIISQAVDNAFAAGRQYYSSAGNGAVQAFAQDFNPDPFNALFNGDLYESVHDFNPDPTSTDQIRQFFLPNGGTLRIFLQWADAFTNADVGAPVTETDLDIFVLNSSLAVVGGSNAVNTSSPFEFVQFTNTTGLDAVFGLAIFKYSDSSPDTERFFIRDFGSTIDISNPNFFEAPNGTGASYGHSGAEGGLGVGASAYFNTPNFNNTLTEAVLNGFSSAGGEPILRDIDGTPLAANEQTRQRVDIVGPDGTDTTFFGSDVEPNGFPNFFGTSAAAPHVAAVGALLLEAVPNATPQEVYDALRASAFGMDNPFIAADDGKLALVDEATGHGFVNPDGALRLLANVVEGDTGRNRLEATGTADDVNILLGQSGNDVLVGAAGIDRLFGGDDDDRLQGKASDDVLFGGAGNDLLVGGRGADWLEGDAGSDTMFGGADADSFVISSAIGRDRIADFEQGVDLIVLTTEFLALGAATYDAILGGTNIRLDGDVVAQVAGVSLVATDFVDETGASIFGLGLV